MLDRINDNAYRVDLQWKYGVSATINMVDLSAYFEDVPLEDLRLNPLQQGEVDGEPSIESSTSQKVQAMVLKAMQQGPHQSILPSLFS